MKRVFKCKVYEGTYSGEVTAQVDEDSIEREGNTAIENAAWREWRREFGPGIGLAATGVKILEEIEE
jgi:hypothetical protein